MSNNNKNLVIYVKDKNNRNVCFFFNVLSFMFRRIRQKNPLKEWISRKIKEANWGDGWAFKRIRRINKNSRKM